ncbi:MAG: VOC family protein [Nanoarchaeota archaeon]|nr:VOC family protein [Nanoarchaeota archaeon]MBU1270377.1 VOC family protein [Nanoarchaeota archaeon]MBU1604334.1 VOC family protein [Nanoarchaeota archaeon]MBU2442747.1 VOC family protein [Nanoarchaeota archaeon]
MSYRLNHIALCVKNPEKSAEFYEGLFSVLGLYVERRSVGENIMMLGLNGTSIGLKRSAHSGSREGVDHFGFTTDNPADLEYLIEQLNGKNIHYERKKHRDGSESLFIRDPDEYMIQAAYMPQDMFIEEK